MADVTLAAMCQAEAAYAGIHHLFALLRLHMRRSNQEAVMHHAGLECHVLVLTTTGASRHGVACHAEVQSVQPWSLQMLSG
jgi:uncharacterized membrane protein